jgi:hypothetical protein
MIFCTYYIVPETLRRCDSKTICYYYNAFMSRIYASQPVYSSALNKRLQYINGLSQKFTVGVRVVAVVLR